MNPAQFQRREIATARKLYAQGRISKLALGYFLIGYARLSACRTEVLIYGWDKRSSLLQYWGLVRFERVKPEAQA